MIVQRPDESEWGRLGRVYGPPRFSDRVWNPPDALGDLDVRDCAGGVILLIFNMAGSCIFVGSNDRSEWFLPMGRIRPGEPIIDAARRVAGEQVGGKIEPVGVPLCERVLLSSERGPILRWYLVVVAETCASELHPQKKTEGREPRPFDLPPAVDDATKMKWMLELHGAGMRYLRSLEALDGT
jgi:ADP-ribose pyrophosphatase YjhB (NUDIX family)